MATRWLKKMVKQWLLSKDAVLSRPVGQFEVSGPKLKKLKGRGVEIQLAIDGGAAGGGWAEMLREVWGQAKVICVEPREECGSELKTLSQKTGGAIYVAQTLLGSTSGMMTLHTHGEQSSALANHEGKGFGQVRQVSMKSLDEVVTQAGMGWPQLIKLDLQGYELEALKGATQCLKQAEFVMLEVSFIQFMKGMPLLAEVVSFMKERGFVCYDIPGLWHRPLDGALAQGDFLFIREGHRLVKDCRWSEDATW